MATIPLPERRAACDGICAVAGEDANRAGLLLHFLNTAFTGFDWPTTLRERALIWQPYIDSGLSIDAFVDEVIRQADLIAQG